jgi:hypothetical protein
MSVAEMVDKLDVLNGVLLFQPLYQENRRSTSIPSAKALFASLGIDVIDGTVRLQQAGPGARLRRGIAQPQPL